MNAAASSSPLPDGWWLGDWHVEPDLNRLSRGEEARLLEPKTMAVLAHLSRRHGQVVSSDELIDAVWEGRPMGDNPVYKSIAKLRRALDDDPAQPSMIVTVQKKGYRLLAPMSTSQPALQAALQPASPAAPDARPASDRRRAARRRSWPAAAASRWLSLALVVAAVGAALIWRSAPVPLRIQIASTGPGSQSQPSLAPDGRSFAFVSDADGTPHVWVQQIGQPAARQLTAGPHGDQRPRWSPDGRTILFGRDGDIWSVPAEGGMPRPLVRDARHPNWSADGARIVFERRYQIWVTDADGGRQTQVAGLPPRALPLAPRWPAFSPDGTRIAFFEAGNTPRGDLWMLPTAGGEPERLTIAPAIGGAPVWSADGRHLVYSSKRGGSRTLWRVDVAARTSRALMAGSGNDDYPDLSRDGHRLIYSNMRERFHLLLSDPATGAERVLHGSRLPLLQPALSPDGRQLAFFGEVPDGSFQIFTMAAASGTPTQLTTDPNDNHALPQWSGDGAWLYFFRSGRELEDVSFSRMPAAGGDTESVVDGWNWNVANGARIHPSLPRVIYSQMTGQSPVQTLVRDLAIGRERTFHATLEYPRWSRDGSVVTGSQFADQRFPGDVAVCRATGPGCRTIATQARIPVWSRDGQRLYYVRGFGTKQDLFMAPADSSGTEQALMAMAPLYPLGPFYDITDRGEVLWVRHEQDPSEVWLAHLPAN